MVSGTIRVDVGLGPPSAGGATGVLRRRQLNVSALMLSSGAVSLNLAVEQQSARGLSILETPLDGHPWTAAPSLACSIRLLIIALYSREWMR